MESKSDQKCKILNNEFIYMDLEFNITAAVFSISDDFYTRRNLIGQELCRRKLGGFFGVFLIFAF